MTEEKVKDITVEILGTIRDEIVMLRKDTNMRFEQMDKRFEQMDKRFEQMDKRFERMDMRLEHIERNIKAIVSHFEKDYMLLANKVGEINGRLTSHLQENHH